MEPTEYLRILRRHWRLIVALTLIGVIVGWVTAPGKSSSPVKYEANAILIVGPNNTQGVNLEQDALLVTTGNVPDRAAARLGLPNSDDIRDHVSGEADRETKSVKVTAKSVKPEEAERWADAVADELAAELVDRDQTVFQNSVNVLTANVNDLQRQLDDVNARIEDNPFDSQLAAQRGALTSEYQNAFQSLQTLNVQGAPAPQLAVLQRASAQPASSDGLQAPQGRPARAALLGGIGLLLGIGAALVLHQLDTKVRGKADAERAFGLPVIAEIPSLPPGFRHRDEIVTTTKPADPFVEAYRALRTVVLFAAATGRIPGSGGKSARNGNGHGVNLDHAGDHQIILVTSPSAGEGKTTTVAHLASVLAEIGKSVLVVSADLRRPHVHDLLGKPREPGLSEILSDSPGAPKLSDLSLATEIPGVSLLASGAPVENPSPFLRASSKLLLAARNLFDYVIIDTAPLLVTNDASELMPIADMVIVITRADHSARGDATRANELLQRLEAPTLGAIVNQATDTPTAYLYYRYRYYGGPAATQRWWERLPIVSKRRRRHSYHSDAPRSAAPPPDREALADVSGSERGAEDRS